MQRWISFILDNSSFDPIYIIHPNMEKGWNSFLYKKEKWLNLKCQA
jgi:hypothetical protein